MSWDQVFFILGVATIVVVVSKYATAAVKQWLSLAGTVLLVASVLRHGPEVVVLLREISDTLWPVLAKAASKGADAFAGFMHSVLR